MEPTIVLPGIGHIPLWKQRRKRQKKLTKNLMTEYAENTTLHGLRYVTHKGLHVVEKAFWLLTFLLSLGICLWQIQHVWHKWQTSPVIVSFNEKFVPIEMVPFPALTICPQIKSVPSKYNYSEEFEKFYKYSLNENRTSMNESDKKAASKLLDVSLTCLPSTSRFFLHDLLINYSVTNSSTVANIIQVSPSLTDYIHTCVWSYDKNCNSMFDLVLTEEGVCFNFNGLAANDMFRNENIQQEYKYSEKETETRGWNVIAGYDGSKNDKNYDEYPYRGSSYISNPTLGLILQVPKNHSNNLCNGANVGFKIYMHHPATHPVTSTYSYALLPGQVTTMAIKYTVINTSESLVKYGPDVRQCFFPSERNLTYFKIYTSSNGMLECLSNITYEICKCVPFHLPHNDSRHICAYKKMSCPILAKVNMSKSLEDSITKKCACLPSCNDITYEAEIYKNDYNFHEMVNHFKKISKDKEDFNYDPFDKNDFFWLMVYYKDNTFTSIIRSELFGLTDFLASCGGLLGLFLGFSILSLVEIFYFFTMRLGCILRKDVVEERRSVKLNKD